METCKTITFKSSLHGDKSDRVIKKETVIGLISHQTLHIIMIKLLEDMMRLLIFGVPIMQDI